MRAVLSTFGSTGDVQPLLALAVELRRHGHHPILALSPNFAGRAQSLGLEFVPTGPRMSAEAIRGVLDGLIGMKNGKPSEQVRQFLQASLPSLPEILRSLLRTCETADVLIGSPFQLACRMVRELTGIPYVSVHLSQFGDLGGEEVRRVSSDLINAVRRKEGFSDLHDPLGEDGNSDQLAIYAVSRHLLPRPAQWPEHYRVAGFFFLDEEDWRPEDELAAFCSAGKPPVIITFGSMVHSDPAAMTDLILEAVNLANCRAIVQHGWSGLARRTMPGNVYAAGFVPHSWLFRQGALIVHHGGAGTSAAAFRSGVPALVVPHTLDQPIWAEFARARGCARSVIPFSQLNGARLGASIRASLSAAEIYRSAAAFAEHIRPENGVRVSRILIEEMLAGGGPQRLKLRAGQIAVRT